MYNKPKTKTYPTKQPKMKHLRKKLQIIKKNPFFFLQACVNVKKNLQVYAHFFQFNCKRVPSPTQDSGTRYYLTVAQ